VPFLLRGIRKGKWNKAYPEWLADDEFPADPVCDFNTSRNMLSLYMVEDLSEHNISRTIAALALTKIKPKHKDHQRIENYDYIAFDFGLISNIGMTLEKSDGQTLDEGINANHYNLIELSVQRLTILAREIKDNFSDNINRVNVKPLARYIQNSIRNNNLDINVVKDFGAPFHEQMNDLLSGDYDISNIACT